MKRLICVILSLVMIFCALPTEIIAAGIDGVTGIINGGGYVIANGYCGGEGNGTNLSWTLDSAGTLTVSGGGKMVNSSYTSPFSEYISRIKRVVLAYGVTSIGNYAFDLCTGLTSVTIPNSVTSIGKGAFRYCDSLISVTIPDSVTSIGIYAFSDCSNLTSVTISKRVTSIGDSVFRACTGLTSITIPDNVTSIGDSVFRACTGLTSVTISKRVKSISDYAFYDCTGLTSVTIPNGVTSIGYEAFYNCPRLTSVTIPNSVTRIGEYAFMYCTGLTSVTIPYSVAHIGSEAFHGCTGLASINVGSYNTLYCSIDGVLFTKDKTELICYPAGKKDTTYSIPNGVTSIDDWAFMYCPRLTSVTIPYSVRTIGDRAFTYCKSLTSINVDSYNSSYCSIYGVLFSKDKTVITCYPEGKGDTFYSIPNGVTSIGDCAFSNCTGLASVAIPNSVTSIGDYAFSGCTGLTSVTIPGRVTSIGGNAFEYCTGLSSITIPSGVTNIGLMAFRYCTGLTSIIIPRSVTSIGPWTFKGCTGLTDIYCETESMPYGWYPSWNDGCSANVHWGKTGADIIAGGFCGGEGDGTNLSWTLDSEGTLTVSGNGAMRDYAMASPTAAAAVMAAFETVSPWTAYTEAIKKVVINEGVTHIGAYSFYNCENLSGVSLPSSIKSIGDYAFYGCSALKNVYYDGDWDGVDIGEGNEPIVKSNKLCGDVNGDGEITSIDRVTLSRYLAGWEGYETINEAAADVNMDGKINSQDRVILSRHLAKWAGYETLPCIK